MTDADEEEDEYEDSSLGIRDEFTDEDSAESGLPVELLIRGGRLMNKPQ